VFCLRPERSGFSRLGVEILVLKMGVGCSPTAALKGAFVALKVAGKDEKSDDRCRSDLLAPPPPPKKAAPGQSLAVDGICVG
jgi:hypothetical protein